MDEDLRVGAVILGAGRSQRMGVPKLSLPWGDTTVIEQIVKNLQRSNVSPIVLVTGGARAEVQRLLSGAGVLFVHNSDYERTEMLESFKIGLREMPAEVSACLVVLGDQPQMKHETVEKLLTHYRHDKDDLIVPSFHMKRGHPWLVGRRLWREIEDLDAHQTLRDFLNNRSSDIHYIDVNTNSILMDLDTPEDYQSQRPKDIKGTMPR